MPLRSLVNCVDPVGSRLAGTLGAPILWLAYKNHCLNRKVCFLHNVGIALQFALVMVTLAVYVLWVELDEAQETVRELTYYLKVERGGSIKKFIPG